MISQVSLVDTNSKKSFWNSKPYWCQPWSIISFGILAVLSSWKLFNNLLISSILGFIVIIWWIVFLILAPNSYKVLNVKK